MSFLAANSGDVAHPRTEMKCRVCGCFSSAQICWHCANNPGVAALETQLSALKDRIAELEAERNQLGEDAIGFATQVDELREQLATARAALEYLADTRDGKLCWCNLPVCMNQPGCQLAREAIAQLSPFNASLANSTPSQEQVP